MKKSVGLRALATTLCSLGLLACFSEEDRASLVTGNLATAEEMIDAFYSFDASKLQPFLLEAGESEQGYAMELEANKTEMVKIITGSGCKENALNNFATFASAPKACSR